MFFFYLKFDSKKISQRISIHLVSLVSLFLFELVSFENFESINIRINLRMFFPLIYSQKSNFFWPKVVKNKYSIHPYFLWRLLSFFFKYVSPGRIKFIFIFIFFAWNPKQQQWERNEKCFWWWWKKRKKIGKASPDKQAVLSKKKKILHYITSIFRAKKKDRKKYGENISGVCVKACFFFVGTAHFFHPPPFSFSSFFKTFDYCSILKLYKTNIIFFSFWMFFFIWKKNRGRFFFFFSVIWWWWWIWFWFAKHIYMWCVYVVFSFFSFALWISDAYDDDDDGLAESKWWWCCVERTKMMMILIMKNVYFSWFFSPKMMIENICGIKSPLTILTIWIDWLTDLLWLE